MLNFLLLFLTTFLSCFAFSQTITGKVISLDGEELPFAKVELKYSNIRTRTSDNGSFSLHISKQSGKDSLIVTYLGYKSHKQVIDLSKEMKPLIIKLEEDAKLIDEVSVVALKYYPAEEIIKNVYKNISKQYSQKTIFCQGFYREVIKENKDWVLMNEAILGLNYGKYPQKKYANKASDAYYNLDYLPWNRSVHSVFKHLVYFPNYINFKEDQVNISQTRSSIDDTKYGTFSSSIGGPFDLLAVDKVKYQSDFLDPKLIKKYIYSNVGQTYLDTTLCYAIRFHPNKAYRESVSISFGDKFQDPIYVGKIYITRDFTVLKIEYEFAENIDFSTYTYFNGKIGPPQDVRVTVNYHQFEGRYTLKSVETFQTKTYAINVGKNQTANYECVRNLVLYDFQSKVKDIPKENLSYLTKSFHIYEFSNSYDADFWRTFEKSENYPALKKTIKKSLEKNLSLEKQFNRFNVKPKDIPAPIATIENSFIIMHGDTIGDQYNWIRNGTQPQILDYLNSENTYYESVNSTFDKKLQRGFQVAMNNLLQHQKLDSINKPLSTVDNYMESNGIQYRYSFVKDMGLFLLKKQHEQEDDTLLNITEFSKEKINFHIEDIQFNQLGNLIFSFSEKDGYSKSFYVYDNQYRLLLKRDSSDGAFWVNDSLLLYIKQNGQLRSNRVFLFNTNDLTERLLYEESNTNYILSMIQNERHIILEANSLIENKIGLISKTSKDYQLRWLNVPQEGQFVNFISNSDDVKDYFSLNNREGKNGIFELNNFQVSKNSIYETSNTINEVILTKDFIVLSEYWLNHFSITTIHRDSKQVNHYFNNDSVKVAYIQPSDFRKNQVTVLLSSPINPFEEYVLDLDTNKLKLIERVILQNGNLPKVEMKEVEMKDSVKVPLMILSNPSVNKDSIKGVILKSYGAYGYPEFPTFVDEDQVYIDRGFVVAYAYVRGGGELGYEWHNQGKQQKKINTFEDYVTCAEYLKELYHLDKSKMVGIGASAGGLTMGYVANNYPDLFGTLIFDRPFLDVLTIMQDSTNVLTEVEYNEWGNPNIETDYEYIKSYSPYQNINQQNYPNMLFLGGYYDQQAPYWQIAKSVAKYRSNNTSNSLILMSLDMNSGHKGGAGGDFKAQKIASFILQTTKNEFKH